MQKLTTLDEFIAKLPKERQRKIHEGAEKLIAEERKRQRKKREKELARLSAKRNPLVSTLRATVAELGGEMSITLKFPGERPFSLNIHGQDAKQLHVDR